MSGARYALGRPSARHSLPVMSGCSVVQKGASSASLNRLSAGAHDQLSSPIISNDHSSVNVRACRLSAA